MPLAFSTMLEKTVLEIRHIQNDLALKDFEPNNFIQIIGQDELANTEELEKRLTTAKKKLSLLRKIIKLEKQLDNLPDTAENQTQIANLKTKIEQTKTQIDEHKKSSKTLDNNTIYPIE